MSKEKKKYIKGKQVQNLFTATNNAIQKEVEFLQESNAIEGVSGFQALECAKEAWEFLMIHEKLTALVILGTHSLLMRGISDFNNEDRGKFRTIPVYVDNKPVLDHVLIPNAIEQWIVRMNESLSAKADDLDINEGISQALHVEYEKIHPFIDGNGRTGRMFMNWFRLKNHLGLLVIHTGKEQQEYYKWFK